MLEFVLPARDREAVLGDLVEEHALRAASSSTAAASRWFWGQVGRSVPPMIWSSLQRGGWLISLGIAAAASVAMGTLKLAMDVLLRRLMHPQEATWIVLTPFVFLLVTVTGGCMAARIRRGAMPFLALIVMVTVALLIRIQACTAPVPWWYQPGFLILGPLSVLIAPAIVPTGRAGGERLTT